MKSIEIQLPALAQIATAYAGIIGQATIVKSRIMAHSAFAMGSDEPCNVFYSGPAGLGKTYLLRAEVIARQIAWKARFGYDNKVKFIESAGEFRTCRDEFSKFRASLQSDGGTIVDELHEMGTLVQGAETIKAFKALLKDDRSSPLRSVKFDDGGEISRPACEIFVGTGTNFPGDISDKAAVISRFGGLTQLELYNGAESREILALILKDKGIRISDGSLDLIADCGRGTARPLEKLVSKLAQIATVAGKATVNREDCFAAMIALDVLPLGLTKRELGIIKLCKVKQDKQGIATHYKVGQKELVDDFGTLRQLGFITTKGSSLIQSVTGAAYLQQIATKGFKL
jgi:Holliday junction resolvasome RuvABC ATP-dependent DNA helicase subunit